MRKIISLILTISLVISLSACNQSKNSLITAVGNTCFDDYYQSKGLYTPDAPFSGMTLNEILLEYGNTSNFSWSANKKIPFFKNFSDQYDNTQVNLVCLTLNSKDTNSKSNTVFSVNKDTQAVLPLGWISEDGKLNMQANNAIVHMYMLIDDEQKEIDISKSMPISNSHKPNNIAVSNNIAAEQIAEAKQKIIQNDYENDDMTETANGYVRFKMGNTEFISKYNKIANELGYYGLKISNNDELTVTTDDIQAVLKERGVQNAHEYVINNSHVHLVIFADKDDKIMEINLVDTNTFQRNVDVSEYCNDWFLGVEVIYRVMTGGTKEDLLENMRNGSAVVNSTWSWGFRKDNSFIVSVNSLFA